MTRLQERLAEIPSRLEQLKRARQRHISRTDPDSRFLRDRRGFTLGYTVDLERSNVNSPMNAVENLKRNI